MAATARVTILMDQAQKKKLTQLARKADMSVGEFVRGRALGTDDEMASLLALVEQSTARANDALDKTLAAIDRRRSDATARHAEIVAATRLAFKREEAVALAELLGLTRSGVVA